jgi:hypothetical protein
MTIYSGWSTLQNNESWYTPCRAYSAPRHEVTPRRGTIGTDQPRVHGRLQAGAGLILSVLTSLETTLHRAAQQTLAETL